MGGIIPTDNGHKALVPVVKSSQVLCVYMGTYQLFPAPLLTRVPLLQHHAVDVGVPLPGEGALSELATWAHAARS